MHSLWRLFLVCVLLLAVPLKGMAAVGMMACSPSHHEGVPASTHAHHASAEAHHAAAPPNAGADHSAHASAQADKCSHCAPCCAAAMLVSHFELPAPVVQRHVVRDLVEVRYPSTHLPGLDRPPRTV